MNFLFMDDNATLLRLVAVAELLEIEDIQRMDLPARSPNLNTIEQVFRTFSGVTWQHITSYQ